MRTLGYDCQVPPTRRGRPTEAERAQRREAALAAALAELVERGYESVTMLDVARRAGSSKESLYTWFGSREEMIAEVIRRQAAGPNARVAQALDTAGDHRAVLTDIARGLLELLLGPASLALNRAAVGQPELARVLLEHGRHHTGPLVERYLAGLSREGHLMVDDPAGAFELLFGLVVRDTQIRALLGDPVPGPDERGRRAVEAVEQFLTLTAAAGHMSPAR